MLRIGCAYEPAAPTRVCHGVDQRVRTHERIDLIATNRSKGERARDGTMAAPKTRPPRPDLRARVVGRTIERANVFGSRGVEIPIAEARGVLLHATANHRSSGHDEHGWPRSQYTESNDSIALIRRGRRANSAREHRIVFRDEPTASNDTPTASNHPRPSDSQSEVEASHDKSRGSPLSWQTRVANAARSTLVPKRWCSCMTQRLPEGERSRTACRERAAAHLVRMADSVASDDSSPTFRSDTPHVSACAQTRVGGSGSDRCGQRSGAADTMRTVNPRVADERRFPRRVGVRQWTDLFASLAADDWKNLSHRAIVAS